MQCKGIPSRGRGLRNNNEFVGRWFVGGRRFRSLFRGATSFACWNKFASVSHTHYILLHRLPQFPEKVVVPSTEGQDQVAEEAAAPSEELRYTEDQGQRDNGAIISAEQAGVVFRQLEYVE